MKTVEQELALLERKRAADRKAQANRRNKLKANGMVLKQVWVKENDPDQTNLVENNHKWLEEELEKKTEELDEMVNRFCEENEKIEKIIFLIEQLREKNKGTVILAKQKDLATLVQQLEEILK